MWVLCCVAVIAVLACDFRKAAAETVQAPQQITQADQQTTEGAPQAAQQTAFVFPGGVDRMTIPVRIINGEVLLRLEVAERGLDVVLDSGSPVNILDPSIVDSLPHSQNGDKTSNKSAVIVDSARLGAVTVHGLAFEALPYARRLDSATTAIGMLGYGFFRNAVVKIDYAEDSVELLDAELFTAPNEGALEIPIDLGEKIPFVRAAIGTTSGDRFVMDTGATSDVVFPQFTAKDPLQFSSTHALQDSDSFHYLRHYFPLCGASEQQPYSVPSISVGNATVRDWVVWRPDEKSCFQRRWDGLIGYDFLRMFTVYFDYPRSRIILEPNDLYKQASNTAQP